MEEQRKIKIDVVVPPYSGHLFPILELIKPLINDEKYDLCVYSGVKRQEFLEKLDKNRREFFLEYMIIANEE